MPRPIVLFLVLAAATPAPAQPGSPLERELRRAQEHHAKGEMAEVIAILEPIVAHRRGDARVGGVVVELLIDAYGRAGRMGDLAALLEELLADREYLRVHRDEKERLVRLRLHLVRKKLEELEREKRWQECGDGYRALYEREPKQAAAAELLYNAGVCYRLAKSFEQAAGVYQLLIRDVPRSRLAQKALATLGFMYGDVAAFEQAAAYYERYASEYPGEKDAPTALSNAARYREALGQDAAAIRDAKLFVKLYGNKLKNQAAGAIFSIAAIYERGGKMDQRDTVLREYLRGYARGGGVARMVVTHAKLGESAWRRSCTKLQGSHCSRERKRRQVRVATNHFERALELARRLEGLAPTDDPGLVDQGRYWAHAAAFYLADTEVDAFLRSGDVAHAKIAEDCLTKGCSRGYRSHEPPPETAPRWGAATAARLAQVADKLGDADRALVQYRRCWQLASRSNYMDEWARLCRVELERRAPGEFPAAREIRPTVDLTPVLARPVLLIQ